MIEVRYRREVLGEILIRRQQYDINTIDGRYERKKEGVLNKG